MYKILSNYGSDEGWCFADPEFKTSEEALMVAMAECRCEFKIVKVIDFVEVAFS